ncbi:MAG: AI-2E family transporter [Neisseria sp.]|nr:AI-2E family transporter [Neisseria sp.]
MYMRKKRGLSPWLPCAAFFVAASWLVLALRDILTPFIVAAVLAYILNPLVEKLRDKGVSRGPASMLVMMSALFLLLAFLLVLIPMLLTQFQNLANRLPQLLDFVQNKALPWFNGHFGEHLLLNKETLLGWLQSHTGTLQNTASKIAPALVEQGGALASGLTDAVLLPLLLYYFLYDWQRWSHGIRVLIPRRFIDGYVRIGGEIDEVLGEFLRGQLMVMLIMGVVYGVGLMLTGLDSGFAIGMVAGLLVFVPYLGAFTGLMLATVAALLQFGSWQGLVLVWLVFVVGQLLESFLVTPKIVGDRIGLSPFWVIFSLMAFGQLMGFVGMLVGLPLAAICLVLLREGAQVYFGSAFYRRER